MQLQTTSSESKFPNEYADVIFTQIDRHLKKLLPKYKEVPILWNTVYGVYTWFRIYGSWVWSAQVLWNVHSVVL